jgi:hypothetical protein
MAKHRSSGAVAKSRPASSDAKAKAKAKPNGASVHRSLAGAALPAKASSPGKAGKAAKGRSSQSSGTKLASSTSSSKKTPSSKSKSSTSSASARGQSTSAAKRGGPGAKLAKAVKSAPPEKSALHGKVAKPMSKTQTTGGTRDALKRDTHKAAVQTPKATPVRADADRAEDPVRLVPAVTDGPRGKGSTAPDTVRGKYVYCVIQSPEPLNFGSIGIGADPAQVFTVNYKDLAAIVSDTALVVHDPTRENVLAHQGVAETVMRNYTVIPMSFGTVFKTREDIVELLRSAYDAFRDVLNKMQNKFEFGLKVLWDRDQIVAEIEREDENVRRLKDEIAGQKGSTYFARMQYGRLVDATLQSRSEQYVAEIFHALRDVAVASRTNKPIGDKMILNAAFLVSRDQESAFDSRVKEIGQRFDGRLTFKYTGPWPPYNFVNIRLKLERAP